MKNRFSGTGVLGGSTQNSDAELFAIKNIKKKKAPYHEIFDGVYESLIIDWIGFALNESCTTEVCRK